ncbi:hypothetical protein IFM89_022580 [Coptis chinensis]|uniref:Ribonucleotide reductase large subunit C-terminal domain-containing protein n=1 Tax=Coptis chinensis TaxID=261450 RepID=A0A835IZC1_9MAGN|nr:hypothetical protein IFM89_022580 [Coptis chinensis]
MDIQVKKQKYIPRSVLYENQLVITIPNSRVMKVIARSILLALIIVTFPFIEYFIQDSRDRSLVVENGLSFNPIDSVLLPLIFQDLIHEGLFKLGDKALFVSSGFYNLNDYENWNILIDNGIDLVLKWIKMNSDLVRKMNIDLEIKQRSLVDMAVDRGCYIDQSQSLNIHMDQPNFGKLTSLHFYAWSKGLKTRMYYLRSHAAADAIKFTVDTSALKVKTKAMPVVDDIIILVPKWRKLSVNREECMACGS